MSNYYHGAFYQPNIYTNTYSLWENSAYYDINNLSPQNYSSSWHRGNDEDFETRYTSGPTEPEPSEPPDHRNRRMVEKSSLYEDPESFYQDVTYTVSCSLFSDDNSTPPPTSEWAPWQNSGEESEESSSGWGRNQMGRTNRVQKTLARIMERGWKGDAVGIGGAITPNALYAIQKRCFGYFKQKTKPTPIWIDYDYCFTMNVLFNIYEFLKNNNEIELLFDRKLSKYERQRLNNIVYNMLNVEVSLRNFETYDHLELVIKICDINCYILQTQSEGVHPDRQLCLYKEAPCHVYLIIPDDLREDPSEDLSTVSTTEDHASDNEAEEETNPFLRSITRNLKKTKEVEKNQKLPPTQPKETSTFEKMLEFFSEFAEKNQYTEFKFVGPFSNEEWDGIREFLQKMVQYLNDDASEYRDVFGKIPFDLAEDPTGNLVINKRPM